METVKFVLPESEMPTAWYNIAADLPRPVPPMLHPGTRDPITADDLLPLFPADLVEQELSTERWIEIPEEVQEVYRQWRPTPLVRARRLERALDTPARIYYKYEGVSPAGSHKPNTAIPQAFYNRKAGTTKLVTETGAGQWGSALSLACSFFGLECEVYWVRVSHDQKPYRLAFMNAFGAEVIPSPSKRTKAGRAVLDADADSPGSLGIAISEAVEAAVDSGGTTKYALGSVLNHVLLHQTVIGEETLRQLEMAGDAADVVVGCTGGGSNFAGIALPFLRDVLAGRSTTRFVAVEPAACPSLTAGRYAYDFGDTVGLTPLTRMHTLGHAFIPPSIHSGGLRYHGMAPIVSHLVEEGLVESRAESQTRCFEAGLQFAKAEGIVPAPEATHAVRGAIDEALRCREEGRGEAIVFNLCGHGHFDMAAYRDYLSGTMQNYTYRPEDQPMALAGLPGSG